MLLCVCFLVVASFRSVVGKDNENVWSNPENVDDVGPNDLLPKNSPNLANTSLAEVLRKRSPASLVIRFEPSQIWPGDGFSVECSLTEEISEQDHYIVINKENDDQELIQLAKYHGGYDSTYTWTLRGTYIVNETEDQNNGEYECQRGATVDGKHSIVDRVVEEMTYITSAREREIRTVPYLVENEEKFTLLCSLKKNRDVLPEFDLLVIYEKFGKNSVLLAVFKKAENISNEIFMMGNVSVRADAAADPTYHCKWIPVSWSEIEGDDWQLEPLIMR
ncbi:hypothetical protein HELRODRAFT_172530 [Helobdella robusta]|uniref:Ig-like domain-containing protein n=1 Tax=Helobdella robusta TaxID=6412 RepID=T1F5G9_HELRO|nr:hypothetical protein HELRODRAFT_172530 [Helobdella robusta]ESO04184.1 hypothetical protein HELRODRAFT_172530 [Helobdella robusta]